MSMSMSTKLELIVPECLILTYAERMRNFKWKNT